MCSQSDHKRIRQALARYFGHSYTLQLQLGTLAPIHVKQKRSVFV